MATVAIPVYTNAWCQSSGHKQDPKFEPSKITRSLSPKPRLTARFPLTRATPPSASSTFPPQRSIRARSLGLSGLWSVVSPCVTQGSTIIASKIQKMCYKRYTKSTPSTLGFAPFHSALLCQCLRHRRWYHLACPATPCCHRHWSPATGVFHLVL